MYESKSRAQNAIEKSMNESYRLAANAAFIFSSNARSTKETAREPEGLEEVFTMWNMKLEKGLPVQVVLSDSAHRLDRPFWPQLASLLLHICTESPQWIGRYLENHVKAACGSVTE